MNTLTARLLAEAFGTFALVLAGTGAIIANNMTDGAVGHVGICLTFGLIVMVMIYAVGEVSGAHFNPAVTIAFAVARRFPWSEVAPYIIAQCLAALAASGLLWLLLPDQAGQYGQTVPAESIGLWQAFAIEIILTLFLMFVILCVATGSKEQGLMAGIAIGGTVALDALFGGPLTGASMNPARSLGPAVVALDLNELWIYIAAPIIGAAISVTVWTAIYPTRRTAGAP